MPAMDRVSFMVLLLLAFVCMLLVFLGVKQGNNNSFVRSLLCPTSVVLVCPCC